MCRSFLTKRYRAWATHGFGEMKHEKSQHFFLFIYTLMDQNYLVLSFVSGGTLSVSMKMRYRGPIFMEFCLNSVILILHPPESTYNPNFQCGPPHGV